MVIEIKSNYLDLAKVRELNLNDVPTILNLVKSVFGNNYIEKEFYDIEIIKDYLKKINEKGEGVWKGVFLNERLIGMMLVILEGNILILKMTMVDNKYKNQGVITKLGPYMLKEAPKFKKYNVKCVYAFVDKDNIPILETLKKFGCIKFGHTPYFEKTKCYLVYGLPLFDKNLYLINPHYKLHQRIEKIIKETRINRKIKKENISFTSIILNNIKCNLKIKKFTNYFPTNYQIFNDKELLADFLENNYNKSWYNLRFLDNISLELKDLILKKIVNLFCNTKNIRSFSIAMDVDDIALQEILLELGFKYCAFLPFYYSGKDAILLGLSKIRNNNKEVYI